MWRRRRPSSPSARWLVVTGPSRSRSLSSWTRRARSTGGRGRPGVDLFTAGHRYESRRDALGRGRGQSREVEKREASFASLCGVSPIEASSGKVVRHRLNRGGSRGANGALHMICVVRMGRDRRTREYVTRRSAEGKSKLEISCAVSSVTSLGRSTASWYRLRCLRRRHRAMEQPHLDLLPLGLDYRSVPRCTRRSPSSPPPPAWWARCCGREALSSGWR